MSITDMPSSLHFRLGHKGNKKKTSPVLRTFCYLKKYHSTSICHNFFVSNSVSLCPVRLVILPPWLSLPVKGLPACFGSTSMKTGVTGTSAQCLQSQELLPLWKFIGQLLGLKVLRRSEKEKNIN
jgi:hypothetical protein